MSTKYVFMGLIFRFYDNKTIDFESFLALRCFMWVNQIRFFTGNDVDHGDKVSNGSVSTSTCLCRLDETVDAFMYPVVDS